MDPYFIKFAIDDESVRIIKSTDWQNPKNGAVIRDTVKMEMSVARVFHRALNRGRLTNIFEKKDYELLGSVLYKILMSDNNVRQFITPEITDTIYNPERRCQISLEFTGVPELASLPWEYIQIPDDNKDGLPALFLSANTSHQFDIYRSVEIDTKLKHPPVDVSAQTQLTVILVLVDESGEKGLKKVDFFKDEMKKLRNKPEHKDENGKAKIEFWEMKNPTPLSFADDLANLRDNINGPYVLHFYGHAQMTDNGAQIGLTDNKQQLTWLSSEDFAEYFSLPQAKQPSLIVLQACESGQVDLQGSGVGIELAQKGIPAVLSMQNIITEETAINFMVQFYDNLLLGRNVAEAVTMGRYFLGCQNKPPAKHCADNTFGTPVLYVTTNQPAQLMPRQANKEKTVRKMQCKACTKVWINPLRDVCPEMTCHGELVPYTEKEEAAPLASGAAQTVASGQASPTVENARRTETEGVALSQAASQNSGWLSQPQNN